MTHSSMVVFDELFASYPKLIVCREDILAAAEALIACYRRDGKLLVCGNGGSAADAGHIVGELMKEFRVRRPVSDEVREALRTTDPQHADYLADHLQRALPAISLVEHSALISAFSNDSSADMVYAQQVYGYGKKGDVLLGLSTSGNSVNVAHAIRVARALSLTTVGLTGGAGGAMRNICDIVICVPAIETYVVQELHLPIYHGLCAALESEFFSVV